LGVSALTVRDVETNDGYEGERIPRAVFIPPPNQATPLESQMILRIQLLPGQTLSSRAEGEVQRQREKIGLWPRELARTLAQLDSSAKAPLSSCSPRAIRARRAYYARKRKPVVRELVGPERVVFREGPPPPIVVEKEVTRFVDRIVLIPRFGIRFPMYVNRLFSGRPKDNESEDMGPNVTAFSKRGA